MPGGWVYIVANRYRGTIYTRVTADIAARSWQHHEGTGTGFAAKYAVQKLVYVERHDLIIDAIAREKAIKKWRREWKINLIEQANPDWLDLFEVINA